MFIELIRLGKDAELKQAGQTEILSLYAAYDVGFGDKKKTQWIGLTMFGKRAAQVAGMMTKGTQIMATMDEVRRALGVLAFARLAEAGETPSLEAFDAALAAPEAAPALA